MMCAVSLLVGCQSGLVQTSRMMKVIPGYGSSASSAIDNSQYPVQHVGYSTVSAEPQVSHVERDCACGAVHCDGGCEFGISSPYIPPRPSSLSQSYEERAEWPLALEDAIEIALQHNRDLKVGRYDPGILSWEAHALDSVYDPVFQIGGEWARTEDQVTSFVDGPGTGIASATTDGFGEPQSGDQLSLSKRLRTGGEFKTDFSSSYSLSSPDGDFLVLNPALRSRLNFQLDHNLWRGVGRDVNMVSVRIAQHVHSKAHRSLEIELRQTVLETASAYWALLGARQTLAASRRNIDETEVVWQNEVEKQKLGGSAAPDVAEARELLERFRVGYTQAQKKVADAERDLRDLMGVPLEDHRVVEPVSRPTTEPPVLDWENSVLRALELRPELKLQETEIQVARLKKFEASDRLKPDLSGYAGWGLSGAAEKFDESLETIHDGDYASWWLGVRYEHRFGRRQDKAALEQAQLTLQQQTAALDQVTNQIYKELHDAFQSVENAWDVAQAARQQREAADTVVEARKEMYRVGEIRLDESLRALTAAGLAAAAEQTALAEYNTALTQWEYARGTILDFTRVQFETE